MISLTGRVDNFGRIYRTLEKALLSDGVPVVEPPHQMHHLRDRQEWTTVEIQNVVFEYSIKDEIMPLMVDLQPNLPWAETHFQERVSGVPHNPPPSHVEWPYAQAGNEEHRDEEGQFSHTYPERMWPKHAGVQGVGKHAIGVRFAVGDLDDLVNLLIKSPYTRQAYLPIWFPEDLTAANQRERVPCTLGYHFMLREDKLNMTYFIRSCDLVRFFRDDVYMACRLVQWVAEKMRDADFLPLRPDAPPVEVGILTMHMVSLHCFEGDLPNMRRRYAAGRT